MRIYLLLMFMVLTSNADWAEGLLDKSSKLYDNTKQKAVSYYDENIKTKELSKEKVRQQRLDEIWSDIFDKFDEGASLVEELETAPDSAILSRDKESVRTDINDIIESIIRVLIDDDLLTYRIKIGSLENDINENNSKIQTYREKKQGAPIEATFTTTKSGYDKKIHDLLIENEIYENDIRIIKDNLKSGFADIGVEITNEQIDVLLVRVDGDDIIAMTLIMDILNHITNEIMQLMKDSNENLSQAKKYYAMNVISLKLVVYIQQKYVDNVNNIYIPKINKIIEKTQSKISDTNTLVLAEKNKIRKAGYKKNVESLRLTFDVAKLYKSNLYASTKGMNEAQKEAKANLKFARNTFETVEISANLYSIVSESQILLKEISQIQVPAIVPFENIQMKNKYKELTKSLQK